MLLLTVQSLTLLAAEFSSPLIRRLGERPRAACSPPLLHQTHFSSSSSRVLLHRRSVGEACHTYYTGAVLTPQTLQLSLLSLISTATMRLGFLASPILVSSGQVINVLWFPVWVLPTLCIKPCCRHKRDRYHQTFQPVQVSTGV